MMRSMPRRGLPRALRVLAVAALALAGCQDTQQDDPATGANPFSSYEEAQGAPGRVLTAGPFTVKVVEPASSVAIGEHRTLLVLSREDRPVTDATLRTEAHMPAMGHGACTDSQRAEGRCPERDPSHEGHGVYVGRTSFIMPGEWLIQVQLFTPASDGQPEFLDIPVQVE